MYSLSSIISFKVKTTSQISSNVLYKGTGAKRIILGGLKSEMIPLFFSASLIFNASWSLLSAMCPPLFSGSRGVPM